MHRALLSADDTGSRSTIVRFENPPGSGHTDDFDELLERIRDIRASDHRVYLRVRAILALAVDLSDLEIQTLERLAVTYDRQKRAMLQGLLRGALALADDGHRTPERDTDMERTEISSLLAAFEAIARDANGVEAWFARDLQTVLGYEQWRNFAIVVDKAREACRSAGNRPEDHFAGVSKMVTLGSGSEREIDDVLLTRYACYLVAQNGDPRKPEIAFAQTYFALQTRKQELIEARLAEHERLRARAQLAASEKELSATLFERLKDGQSFARIRSAGDTALFGGHTTADMKQRLGVPGSRPLADFLPSITIKAKDLANEMTTFQVRQRDLRTEPSISCEHVANNREVRNALGARGIRPEDLPAEEDAKKLERRLHADERKLSGPSATLGKDSDT